MSYDVKVCVCILCHWQVEQIEEGSPGRLRVHAKSVNDSKEIVDEYNTVSARHRTLVVNDFFQFSSRKIFLLFFVQIQR